ncbi:hypothetical protein [Chlorogloeopsis sp. ULAP02]|uniref:class I SAM-dependent methyltransferase n=1 Tax=Chlorogloeopsis sp. ULAP02 TaxID=3107926 RepID=UPI003135DDC3
MSDIYNSIGQQYSKTCIPDPRIVKTIIDLLNLPKDSIIADIGVGTGGYSLAIADEGCSIYAIAPSLVMRSQAPEHPQLQWFAGYCDRLSSG